MSFHFLPSSDTWIMTAASATPSYYVEMPPHRSTCTLTDVTHWAASRLPWVTTPEMLWTSPVSICIH